MSLKKYAEKRHFEKTPEPAPGKTPVHGNALQFCVQRHHASHLHYDFRLEVGGTLKSWAVPKGPTLDPEQKRLAMMVEDHPLEYGGFEGVIPKGNYGAGSVMLWDRGTYELLGDATAEEQLARGDFKFRVTGQKLKGEFAIVRMKRGKGNEWLLIKKKDAAAQVGWDPEDHSASVLTGRMQEEIARGLEADPAPAKPAADMPKIITPMLAELGKGEPPEGGDWVYEIKWDGVRAICFIEGGKLRMISRNGNVIDKQYPELSILPHQLRARSAIVDGEIAALDAQGRPSFELLQSRMHVADASAIARLARSHPVVFYAFDLLYLDGRDLRAVPLIERTKLLKDILQPNETIRYSEHFATSGAELLAAAKEQGLEGVVGKRGQSRYESRRSSDWMKWKVVDSEDFVICGYTEGDRHGLGALVLGTRSAGGKLTWAGNVGTGFDAKMVKTLFAKLAPLVTKESPLEPARGLPRKVVWTKPELICEVRFANWTEEGRLRAPVFLGLREDLDPQASPRAALLDASLKEAEITIDGHRLKFTNLDKLFYPKDGYRKRDLLNYYDAVAPLLVPHLKGRPLSLKRYPNGIDKPFFFQKQIAESFPKWLHTAVADEIEYVIGDDRATLLYLVNLGCIDHNPWMSRVGTLENPDYVLIDLDPYECSYEKIVEAALWVRAKLDSIELVSYPKTTGGDGIHIFIPLEPVYTYAQVRSFAEVLSVLGAAARPDLFTTPRAISKREKGKVYFDWQQIAQGKTISAPYVLRAYPGAPVATPLAWNEVTPRLRPEQFHLRNALGRFERVGDLFEGVLKRPQRLEAAIEKLAKAV
ncbi:MAG TPA: DNA ligase D [Bryobacteraceae bacterium]|nr:DNA ligase D [Bryobacteraceae bacterium]